MKTVLQTALTCMMLVICASGYSDTNVALRGRATQSSVLVGQWENIGYLGSASNAIDGNPDPTFLHGSCSHTNREFGPWWRLDMLDEYQVNSVSITNRNQFPEWLNGAEIRIGNSLANNGNNNPRCAVIANAGSGETRTLQCHGMKGRYLNVVIPGKTAFLTFAEVQVLGDLVMGHAG
ncbi:fucolectin-like [Pleurodeles waltl]|uniref:fucolectin-like n=1 Tax=Pleurodeles waltl TaxID=8319 RepID=UPI0037093ED2